MTAAIGIVAVAGTPSASAQPVSLTLRYTCGFGGLGNRPVTMRLSTDIPSSLELGEASPRSALNGVATVDADFTQLAPLVGAKTMEGTVDGTATVSAPQGSIPLSVPLRIPRTAIPASGSFDMTADGTAPAVTFSRPGNAKVTVGDLTLHLTPRDADGNTTAVGTINAPCALDSGQNTVLKSLVITEPVKAPAATRGASTTGTRPGAGPGRSTSVTTTTPSPAAPSSTGSVPPRTPTPSPGAPTVEADATTAADDEHGDPDPKSPIALTMGVLVVGGAAALVGLGARLRKRRAGDADG